MQNVSVHYLSGEDLEAITAAVRELGGDKPRSQYERYLAEQEEGSRTVLVGLVEDVFAGYVTLNRSSDYPPFREGGIPEIQDLNVLPRFRRLGVATLLIKRAEREVVGESDTVGIGVGLTSDYGPAQRLYALLGFAPDRRGLTRHSHPVAHREEMTADDTLALYMTKALRTGTGREHGK